MNNNNKHLLSAQRPQTTCLAYCGTHGPVFHIFNSWNWNFWLQRYEFGMNFHLSFFMHKKGWYHKVCFSYVYGMWISDKDWMQIFHIFAECEFLINFKICFHIFMGVWIFFEEWMDFKVHFSYVCGMWISGKEWMNFKVHFSYVHGMWISDEFKVCFSYVYRGVNFWQRMDEFQGMFFMWISDNGKKGNKSPSKKKMTKVTFVTLHILMIYLVNFMS